MTTLLSLCLRATARFCSTNEIHCISNLHPDLCEKIFLILKREYVLTPAVVSLFSGCGLKSISLQCNQSTPIHRIFMFEHHLLFNPYTKSTSHLSDPLDELMYTTTTPITDLHLNVLSTFHDLERLDLTNCYHIENLAGLSGLTRLTSLSLANCILIKDQQMEHLRGLCSLVELRLDGVKISEKGILFLSTLTQLEQLWLHNNPLLSSATVYALSNFPSLHSLSFGYSAEITPENVKHLFAMTNLTSLDLRNFPHTYITGPKFSDKQKALNTAMGNIQHLKYLNISISGVYMSDEFLWRGLDISTLDALDIELIVSHDIFALEPILSESSKSKKKINAIALKYCHIAVSTLTFPALINLTFLDLNHSDINDIGFESVAKLSNLAYLDISYCTSLPEDSLLLLAKLTNLRHLNLTSTQSSDFTVSNFATKLVHLVELFLDFTKVGIKKYLLPDSLLSLSLTGCASFDEEGVYNLRNLINLQNLEFHYCAPLTTYGLNSLKKLSHLKTLYLPVPSDSVVVHTLLAHFTNLTSLRCYDSVHITNETANLSNFTNLKDLSLPECHRWNSIDTLAPSIVNLHLSGCSLKDSDFANIAALKLLLVLDISGNTNISDHGLSLVATAATLTSLNLNGLRKITHKGVSQLTKLRKLHCLSTFQCSLVDHEEDRLAFLLDEKRVTKLVLENGYDKVKAYQFAHLRSLLNTFSSLVRLQCKKIHSEYTTKVDILKKTVNNKGAMLDQIRCVMKPPEIWLMMQLWDKKEAENYEDEVMSCLAIHAEKRYDEVKEMLGLSWKDFTAEHRAGVQTMAEMFGELGSKKRDRSSLLHAITKSKNLVL